MNNDIRQLETTEPVSMIEALSEGVGRICDNMGAFFKMCKPILILAIALLLCFIPAALAKHASTFFETIIAYIIAYTLILIGLGLFIYGFWKFLLGAVAVIYLAKDIFENKPVQSYEAYMSYIEEFGGEYAIFWLICAGLQLLYIIGAAILGFCTGFFGTTIGTAALWFFIAFIILYFVFAIPFFIGAHFSPVFFAFEDKLTPFKCIKHAIKTSYDNWLEMVPYSLILGIISTIVSIVLCILIVVICTPLLAFGKMPYSIINTVLSIIVSFIIFYFQMFAFTRYYFELIKKR